MEDRKMGVVVDLLYFPVLHVPVNYVRQQENECGTGWALAVRRASFLPPIPLQFL
jgi:hypothetical protein